MVAHSFRSPAGSLNANECRALLRWASLGGVPNLSNMELNEHDFQLNACAFDHGQSNPTYLVTIKGNSLTKHAEFQFVVRSQPRGKLLKSAHRIDREFRVLSALQSTAVPVPRIYGYCERADVIGSSFYAMQYLSGRVFQDASLQNISSEKERSEIYQEAVRILLLLRELDVRKLNLQDFSRSSSPWIERQVSTWYRQYKGSTLTGRDYSSMEKLYMELLNILRKRAIRTRSKAHPSLEHGLVHGDYRLDNLVFHPVKPICIGVLDWELATVGDPLADLASFLSPYVVIGDKGIPDILNSVIMRNPRPSGIPSLQNVLSIYMTKGKVDTSFFAEEINLFLIASLFRFAAILNGVEKRATQGNAASTRAAEIGAKASICVDSAFKLLRQPIQVTCDSEKSVARGIISSPLEKVGLFMKKEVFPLEADFMKHVLSRERWNPWLPLESLKRKAKEEKLWNFFLPIALGGSYSSSQYAPIAALTGQCVFAAEVFNCSAPDTGNMELLARFGTPEQKKMWLQSLLDGSIRSCFAMTEPDVASSDATNIQTKIHRVRSGYMVSGRKWWTSGAMDKRCKLILLLGRGPGMNEAKHRQHSIVLIPMNAPGVKIVRPLSVFGYDDAPHGHAELLLESVKIPKSYLLHAEGGGFEAAQSRLGGGRLHHCMRLIGVAERALKLMVERSKQRKTFGVQFSQNEAIIQSIGACRCDIETMRSVVFSAADAVDSGNVQRTRQAVGVAKVVAPKLALQVLDRAIQLHGGLGVCQDTPLALLYASTRTLRLADGPDEVHLRTVGRNEIRSRL